MNKALIVGIAGLLVFSGATAGGSLYVNQQQTGNAYSLKLMHHFSNLANFQTQPKLGILSGSAQW